MLCACPTNFLQSLPCLVRVSDDAVNSCRVEEHHGPGSAEGLGELGHTRAWRTGKERRREGGREEEREGMRSTKRSLRAGSNAEDKY